MSCLISADSNKLIQSSPWRFYNARQSYLISTRAFVSTLSEKCQDDKCCGARIRPRQQHQLRGGRTERSGFIPSVLFQNKTKPKKKLNDLFFFNICFAEPKGNINTVFLILVLKTYIEKQVIIFFL